MTGLWVSSAIIGAFLFGAVLTAAIGFPHAERRGYARAVDEQRLYDGVSLAREVHPIVEQALPEHDWPSWGPGDAHAEFRRVFSFRLRRPSWPRWDVLSVGAKVDAGLAATQTPIGAEPASAFIRDRSGLASPAAGTSARTSGNAAPPLKVEAPPQAGAPAGTLLGLLPEPVDLAAEYAQRERAESEPQPGDPGHPDYPWTVKPFEPGLGEHDEQEPEHRAKHAAEPDDHDATGEFWTIVGAGLFEQGLLVADPALALPCTRCESDHAGCVGCACPCKLQEVA
jgi:hypothetical protein